MRPAQASCGTWGMAHPTSLARPWRNELRSTASETNSRARDLTDRSRHAEPVTGNGAKASWGLPPGASPATPKAITGKNGRCEGRVMTRASACASRHWHYPRRYHRAPPLPIEGGTNTGITDSSAGPNEICCLKFSSSFPPQRSGEREPRGYTRRCLPPLASCLRRNDDDERRVH